MGRHHKRKPALIKGPGVEQLTVMAEMFVNYFDSIAVHCNQHLPLSPPSLRNPEVTLIGVGGKNFQECAPPPPHPQFSSFLF